MDRVDFAEARGRCMYINQYPISYYQDNCRIYLDEFEVEEVDLRVCFDTSILMKKFTEKL